MMAKKSTKYRPEQVLAFELLSSSYFKDANRMEMEYKVPEEDLQPNDLNIHPVLDIFMQIKDTKYAIELNGPIHDGTKQRNKDELRYIFLESHGYTPVILSHRLCPTLFKRNKRNLKEHELGKACMEIYDNVPKSLRHQPVVDKQIAMLEKE